MKSYKISKDQIVSPITRKLALVEPYETFHWTIEPQVTMTLPFFKFQVNATAFAFILSTDKVLDELRKAGYQLGIISNFDERIYRILENMNLHGYFDFVQIPSSCEGFAKPSPEIFQATRALANRKYGPPLLDHQFLHVGDNVELDYRAARASGFQALLLCHNADDLAAVKEDDVILRNGDYALDLVQLKDKVLDKFWDLVGFCKEKVCFLVIEHFNFIFLQIFVQMF